MSDLKHTSDPQQSAAHAQSGLGAALAELSTALVRLHKRFYGKGPVRAKSFVIDDMVICVLEGGFTIVERTLIDMGRGETVRELRREFQAAMTDEFTSAVEQSLGRTVRGYMSQVHTDPDIAIEVFVLEPAAQPPKLTSDVELSPPASLEEDRYRSSTGATEPFTAFTGAGP